MARKKKEIREGRTRKRILIAAAGLVLLIVAGVVGFFAWKNGGGFFAETDAVRFAREYTKVPEENAFVYRDAREIIDILRGGTGVVFFGFSECPWCQAYAPILNEVAREFGLKKIFYYDVREDRANNTEEYQEIVGILRDDLDSDDEGRAKIFVPDAAVVDKGEIIGNDNETSLISDADATPEGYWTEEKIAALKERLRGMVERIAESACADVCE